MRLSAIAAGPLGASWLGPRRVLNWRPGRLFVAWGIGGVRSPFLRPWDGTMRTGAKIRLFD